MFSKSFPLTLWAALCFLLISPLPGSASIVVNGTAWFIQGMTRK